MLQLKPVIFGHIHCGRGKQIPFTLPQVFVCLETDEVDLQVEGLVPCYHKHLNGNYTRCLSTVAGNVEVNLKLYKNLFSHTQYLVVWLPDLCKHFRLTVL